MPKRLGCALLLRFGSTWLLTRKPHEQGCAVTIESWCDHPVTEIVRAEDLQSCLIVLRGSHGSTASCHCAAVVCPWQLLGSAETVQRPRQVAGDLRRTVEAGGT